MNKGEKAQVIQNARTLAADNPAYVTGDSLESIERLVEELPADMPNPKSMHISGSHGNAMLLRWEFIRDHCSYLSVDVENRLRGYVYKWPSLWPSPKAMASFIQDANESVRIPAHFMAAFREMRDERLALLSEGVGEKHP